MRIGIVNDMPLAVEALRRALAFEPQHQIVWVASNGAEAVTQCAADTPDVVLMDLLMPVMDGVEATRRIMAESPCAIVIVTVDIEQNVHRVFEAMGYGALDAVNTPALGIGNPQTAAAPLLRKIQNVGWLIGQRDNRGKVQVVPPKAGGRASVWWRSAPRLAVRRRSRCCSSNCRPVSMPRWCWCSMSTRYSPPAWPNGWPANRSCRCAWRAMASRRYRGRSCWRGPTITSACCATVRWCTPPNRVLSSTGRPSTCFSRAWRIIGVAMPWACC